MKYSEFKRGINELGLGLHVGEDSYMVVDEEGLFVAEIYKNGIYGMNIDTRRKSFKGLYKDWPEDAKELFNLCIEFDNTELEDREDEEDKTECRIESPTHYKLESGRESIEILREVLTDEELKGFYKGNILKYLFRHEKKNGKEDLEKARVYLNWLIEI